MFYELLGPFTLYAVTCAQEKYTLQLGYIGLFSICPVHTTMLV